jgi:hypothetical protein
MNGGIEIVSFVDNRKSVFPMRIPEFGAEAALVHSPAAYRASASAGRHASLVPSLFEGWNPWTWIAGVAVTRAPYAGCYWACVADTGEWEDCGDTCAPLKL